MHHLLLLLLHQTESRGEGWCSGEGGVRTSDPGGVAAATLGEHFSEQVPAPAALVPGTPLHGGPRITSQIQRGMSRA